jgi:hypothetical protein
LLAGVHILDDSCGLLWVAAQEREDDKDHQANEPAADSNCGGCHTPTIFHVSAFASSFRSHGGTPLTREAAEAGSFSYVVC